MISSALSDAPERLFGIGVTVNDKGYVDGTKNGLPGVFRNADECDLDSPNDDFVLECTWRFTADQRAQAEHEFERLKKRLNDCLPVKLEQQAIAPTTQKQLEGYAEEYGTSFVEHFSQTEKLGRYKQVIDLDSGFEVEVAISLNRDKRSGRLWMNAMLYRD